MRRVAEGEAAARASAEVAAAALAAAAAEVEAAAAAAESETAASAKKGGAAKGAAGKKGAEAPAAATAPPAVIEEVPEPRALEGPVPPPSPPLAQSGRPHCLELRMPGPLLSAALQQLQVGIVHTWEPPFILLRSRSGLFSIFFLMHFLLHTSHHIHHRRSACCTRCTSSPIAPEPLRRSGQRHARLPSPRSWTPTSGHTGVEESVGVVHRCEQVWGCAATARLTSGREVWEAKCGAY